MTEPSLPPQHIIAFDVGKQALEVATLPRDKPRSIANQSAAIRRVLQAEIRRNEREVLGPILVICEATGGYEHALLALANELQLPIHRAEGRRVRLFAQAHGLRAKTDPLDAAIIARFARQADCSMLYSLPSVEQQALSALVTRREELLQMKLAEQNRLEHHTSGPILVSIRYMIDVCKQQIKAIEQHLGVLIRQSPELSHKNQLLQSLVGIGDVTARTLMATLPELGTLSKGQAASLTGLAPYNRDSGNTNQHRHIAAGRFAARRCLYMAATVAINKNPVLRAKFQQLTQNGKPYKVALVAIMRKMIIILNAILKQQKPWKHAQIT